MSEPRSIWSIADLNKDGKVDQNEYKAFIRGMDLDNNGEVSVGEVGAWLKHN